MTSQDQQAESEHELEEKQSFERDSEPDEQTQGPALNQPRRWIVVAVEALLIAGALVAMVLVWRQATPQVYIGSGVRDVSFRPRLVLAAIGFAVLAGLLLLDLLRQMVLAIRVRH
ncbi:hypothetical protein D5S17_16040 [Pseudonocardiaceae bacterium YIM PH 21723]|nr:hypothetical protein D5S17_16040 [Pseudonocardiaceae bacterium YIM PH 21723]